MTALDLDAIRARANAATSGPWYAGDVWVYAGIKGDGVRCGLCHHGAPVWTGQMNINGQVMPAHKHRSLDPYAVDHMIVSDVGVVAGRYTYDDGGIVNPADTAFVVAARTDVPALVDEVERLRAALRALADYATDRAHAHIDGTGLAQAGFASIAATALREAGDPPTTSGPPTVAPN